MEEKLDIVIFGATGFGGKHTIPVLYKMIKLYGPHLKWGIAGRSETKLKEALKFAENETNASLTEIPIILAQIEDESSLNFLASKTRVLINCCGPYLLFGEPVVKACIQNGTHYVDLSAEPQFIASLHLNYPESAAEKNSYIVHSCGFDCIPTDLGLVFLEKHFGGILNSVDIFVKVWNGKDGRFGPAINRGTWDSAIQGVSRIFQIKDLYKKLFPENDVDSKPELRIRWIPFRTDREKLWAVVFPSADRLVIKKSQQYFQKTESKRPVQAETYVTVDTFLGLSLLLIGGFNFLFWSLFSCGRYLLEKHPRFFSGGFINSKSPPEDMLNAYQYSFTLCGKGWSQINGEVPKKTNKTFVGRVSGANPGYGISAIGLALSAITLLIESDKLPKCGGVYTVGSAFAKTSLVDKISENGITFEILTENVDL